MVFTTGPAFYERAQANAGFTALERQQVTREVPDLTGRVVAFVTAYSPNGASALCATMLRYSGADAVYIIPPFRSAQFLAGDYFVDLSGAFDLNVLVTGQARLASRETLVPGEDEELYCAIDPLPQPSRPVDYFVMEGGFYGWHAFFSQVDALRIKEIFEPGLDGFFGPVNDPSSYHPKPENADLLRFSAFSQTFDIPFSFLRTRYDATQSFRRDPAIRGALCRYGPDDCLDR